MFTLSIQTILTAQPSQYSCTIEEEDLDGWEMWEENSKDCFSCEIDGDPEPVYDSHGNLIGWRYIMSPVRTTRYEVVCNWTVEGDWSLST